MQKSWVKQLATYRVEIFFLYNGPLTFLLFLKRLLHLSINEITQKVCSINLKSSNSIYQFLLQIFGLQNSSNVQDKHENIYYNQKLSFFAHQNVQQHWTSKNQ